VLRGEQVGCHHVWDEASQSFPRYILPQQIQRSDGGSVLVKEHSSAMQLAQVEVYFGCMTGCQSPFDYLQLFPDISLVTIRRYCQVLWALPTVLIHHTQRGIHPSSQNGVVYKATGICINLRTRRVSWLPPSFLILATFTQYLHRLWRQPISPNPLENTLPVKTPMSKFLFTKDKTFLS
jgi:hypothetical protein